MRYVNAAEVLPQQLLMEIQRYINGDLLYIPNGEVPTKWGEKSGSKSYYETRNKRIKQKYQDNCTIEQIAKEFGLAYETVRKIVYKK